VGTRIVAHASEEYIGNNLRKERSGADKTRVRDGALNQNIHAFAKNGSVPADCDGLVAYPRFPVERDNRLPRSNFAEREFGETRRWVKVGGSRPVAALGPCGSTSPKTTRPGPD
jgi:hypothetical protein